MHGDSSSVAASSPSRPHSVFAWPDVGEEQIHFGQKALRLPARTAPEGVARVVRRFADERLAGEPFSDWLKRIGGPSKVADGLRDLDDVPTPDENPEYFTDYDETGPFVAQVAESECAT